MAASDRRTISKILIKRLYQSHGGLCAFTDCPYPGHLPDGTPMLQIAHIVPLSRFGSRADSALTQDQGNEESNLILLCPSHHAMIDRMPSEYPAERVRGIRDTHVARVAAILSSANGTLIRHSPAASKIQQALSEWRHERNNSSEEFWQQMFTGRPELLAAAAYGRAFTLNSKCYVGGKAVTNRGGNVLDFLAQHGGDVVLIEIKTPTTRLLGAKYRDIFPPSHELAGAVTQALNYRLSLLSDLHGLRAQSPKLNVHHPTVFVLVGDSGNEDMSEPQRHSFEIFRNSIKDVVIQTYDELFDGIANLAVWMEPL